MLLVNDTRLTVGIAACTITATVVVCGKIENDILMTDHSSIDFITITIIIN